MSTISFGLVLFSLMLITSETSALKCWRCSSDSTIPFCQEKLDHSLVTPQELRWAFVECSLPVAPVDVYGQKMVSKCRIQLLSLNGQKLYSRSCVAEAETAERDECIVKKTIPGVQILACETCREDGCNEFLQEKREDLETGNNTSAVITRSPGQSLTVNAIVFGLVWLLF